MQEEGAEESQEQAEEYAQHPEDFDDEQMQEEDGENQGEEEDEEEEEAEDDEDKNKDKNQEQAVLNEDLETQPLVDEDTASSARDPPVSGTGTVPSQKPEILVPNSDTEEDVGGSAGGTNVLTMEQLPTEIAATKERLNMLRDSNKKRSLKKKKK